MARNEAISELYKSPVYIFTIGLLVCLFMSANVLAQNKDTVKKGTVKTYVTLDGNMVLKPTPLYIVDGKVTDTSDNKLKHLDPKSVLQIDVLKNANVTAQYGPNGANGVIIVITKAFAIEQYQKRFSSLSVKYKVYLSDHNNDDGDINYILDGGVVNGKPDEIIGKLYNRLDNVKTFAFIENPYYNGGMSKKYLVTISTK